MNVIIVFFFINKIKFGALFIFTNSSINILSKFEIIKLQDISSYIIHDFTLKFNFNLNN